MWLRDKFFKYALSIIAVLLIIFLMGKVSFVLVPILELIAVLFLPLVVAGLLYYLLRPLVRLIGKTKINRSIGILLLFALLIAIFALLGAYSGSLISKQLTQLTSNLPSIVLDAQTKITELIKDNKLGSYFDSKLQEQATKAIESIGPVIANNIFGAFTALTSIATVLIMVPFILFFFLRDDYIFIGRILSWIPKRFRKEADTILVEVDKTLEVYIIGQALLALILGILTYIGYMIIGLPYALILALFAIMTSFIPMFGSAIGIIPAMLVGLSNGPLMVLKVLIIMIAINQLEGNLISPFLVGKRLDIHPLVLILLFLVAASFYGFIGMLIAVPTYAVCKVIIKNIIQIYKTKREEHNFE